MNNQFNFPDNKNKFTDANRSGKKESFDNKIYDDLIIEENTIYEIDRKCVERLKRNRKR